MASWSTSRTEIALHAPGFRNLLGDPPTCQTVRVNRGLCSLSTVTIKAAVELLSASVLLARQEHIGLLIPPLPKAQWATGGSVTRAHLSAGHAHKARIRPVERCR